MMYLLLGAAWKSVVVLGVAYFAAWTCRRASADLRHRIWLGGLLATAALLIPIPIAQPAQLQALVLGTARAGLTRSAVSWTTWALWLWAVGAAAFGARLLLAVGRLVRLSARATHEHANLFASQEIGSPLTWGVFRPVILMPAYAFGWPQEKLDRAIRHEEAHIARQDWLWQMFAQAMTCVFWFHPLVWLAAARLRSEAEHAADDAVLATGAQAEDYAAQLVEVARLLQGRQFASSVSMVRTPLLEVRLMSILNSARKRQPAGWPARLTIAAVALGFLLPLAAYQHDVHKMGEPGLTAPRVLTQVQPQYTEEAKSAKIQGNVTLGLEVDPDGKAQNIYVVRSLDKGLDENAIEAIKQWTFSPGEKDGRPVAVSAVIEVNYRLL